MVRLPVIRGFEHADELTLLAIMVALAAYLATVRFYLISQFEPKPGVKRDKGRIHRTLWGVGAADILVTTSAILIAVHALFEAPGWTFNAGVWFAVAAAILLLVFHVFAWGKTFFGEWSGRRSGPAGAIAEFAPLLGAFTCTLTLSPQRRFEGTVTGTLEDSARPPAGG